MDKREEETKPVDLRTKQQILHAVADQFKARKSEMEKELQELQGKLPFFLAGVLLKEIPKTELAKIKRRIHEIDGWLKDYDATCRGLDKVWKNRYLQKAVKKDGPTPAPTPGDELF
ncbi:MAG: hypothetical protein ACE144_13940 [Thermodesulfobacteriota bacterium]